MKISSTLIKISKYILSWNEFNPSDFKNLKALEAVYNLVDDYDFDSLKEELLNYAHEKDLPFLKDFYNYLKKNKTFFENFIIFLKKGRYTEILNFEKFPLFQQFDLIRELSEIIDIDKLVDLLIAVKNLVQILRNVFKNESKALSKITHPSLTLSELNVLDSFSDAFLSGLMKIYYSEIFQDEEDLNKEDLDLGSYGLVRTIPGEPGVLEKTIFDPQGISDSGWVALEYLAKQDASFYKNFPLSRVFDVNKELRSYKMEIAHDIGNYSKKLDQGGRYLIFNDPQGFEVKPFKVESKEDLLKKLKELKVTNLSVPTCWSLDGSYRLCINDRHIGNVGFRVNKGTLENPDEIIHIDLDTVRIIP